MACTSIQNRLHLLFPQGNFDNLIEQVATVIPSQKPQNYLALFVVFQQEIEAVIREEDPQIKMEGDILSAEITQSRGFDYQLKKSLPTKLLDPAFASFLDGNEAPLTESILVTRTKEKVEKTSKAMLIICRTDKRQSTLKAVCELAKEKLIKMKNSIEGSSSFYAQVLLSDNPLHFPLLNNSSEPAYLENAQASTTCEVEHHFEQLETILDPRECLLFKKTFDHGEVTETNTRMSFALKDGIITTAQRQETCTSVFTDLKSESETSYSMGSDE
jgi:hypothetical protein